MKTLLLILLAAGVTLLGAGEKDHRKAAVEMMQASGVPGMLKRSFDAQLENQIKAVPELEKLRPQLTEFYNRAFSFRELEPDLSSLYMKYYTLEEMKQITAFYKTPVGKKMAVVNVKLSSELGALFLKHAEKKMAELEKLLKKLVKE